MQNRCRIAIVVLVCCWLATAAAIATSGDDVESAGPRILVIGPTWQPSSELEVLPSRDNLLFLARLLEQGFTVRCFSMDQSALNTFIGLARSDEHSPTAAVWQRLDALLVFASSQFHASFLDAIGQFEPQMIVFMRANEAKLVGGILDAARHQASSERDVRVQWFADNFGGTLGSMQAYNVVHKDIAMRLMQRSATLDYRRLDALVSKRARDEVRRRSEGERSLRIGSMTQTNPVYQELVDALAPFVERHGAATIRCNVDEYGQPSLPSGDAPSLLRQHIGANARDLINYVEALPMREIDTIVYDVSFAAARGQLACVLCVERLAGLSPHGMASAGVVVDRPFIVDAVAEHIAFANYTGFGQMRYLLYANETSRTTSLNFLQFGVTPSFAMSALGDRRWPCLAHLHEQLSSSGGSDVQLLKVDPALIEVGFHAVPEVLAHVDVAPALYAAALGDMSPASNLTLAAFDYPEIMRFISTHAPAHSEPGISRAIRSARVTNFWRHLRLFDFAPLRRLKNGRWIET
jgi:hypothetical protein